MSRSRKKPILKDSPSNGKRLYHRIIRRVSKQMIKEGKDIPHRNSIIDQYDYCDWIFRMYVEKGCSLITAKKEKEARRK